MKIKREFAGFLRTYKLIRIVLLIELVMFIVSVIVLFRPMNDHYISDKDMNIISKDNINHIISDKIDLRSGSYYIKIHYNNDSVENTFSLRSDYNTYPVAAMHTNMELEEGTDKTTELELFSCLKVGGFYIDFTDRSDGVSVTGVEINENHDFRYILFFCVVCLSVIINLFLFWFYGADKNKRMVCVAMIALSLISSAPYVGYYITVNSHDLAFHLNRIAAISRSLNDQFPVRIPTFWNNGYGYAASVFYNDLFLYFPAFLRRIGFTLQTSYKYYVVMINIVTCCLAFYSFRKTGRSDRVAMIVTWLYVLSPYRLMCIYTRGAVGEYTAMAFYPLVVYGLYNVYAGDHCLDCKSPVEKTEHEFRIILPLLAGICGLVSCHVLSCVMLGFFILLTCIILWKSTLRPQVIARLSGALLGAVLINAWYVIPFLDYYRDKYATSLYNRPGAFGARGAYLWQLFAMFPNAGTDAYSFAVADDYGLKNEMSYALGFYFVLSILAVLLLLIYDRELFKSNKLLKLSTWYAIMSAFMAFYLFPWDFMEQLNGSLAAIIENIQFPWRFIGLFTVFASISTLILLVYIHDNKKQYFIPVSLTLIILMFVTCGYYLDELTQKNELVYYGGEQELESTNIGGAEYLPLGTDVNIFDGKGNISYPADDVLVLSEKRENDVIMIECINNNSAPSYLDISLLFYRYYHAIDPNSKEEFQISKNADNCIRVMLPGNHSGTVCVRFTEPILWRAGELITFISVVVLFVLVIRLYKAGKGQHL